MGHGYYTTLGFGQVIPITTFNKLFNEFGCECDYRLFIDDFKLFFNIMRGTQGSKAPALAFANFPARAESDSDSDNDRKVENDTTDNERDCLIKNDYIIDEIPGEFTGSKIHYHGIVMSNVDMIVYVLTKHELDLSKSNLSDLSKILDILTNIFIERYDETKVILTDDEFEKYKKCLVHHKFFYSKEDKAKILKNYDNLEEDIKKQIQMYLLNKGILKIEKLIEEKNAEFILKFIMDEQNGADDVFIFIPKENHTLDARCGGHTLVNISEMEMVEYEYKSKFPSFEWHLYACEGH